MLPSLLLLATLATGCTSGPDAGVGGGPPPTPVEVGAARDGSLSEDWRTLGDVVALDRAELAAGATGPMASVKVREGDRVAAGAVLAEVDTDLAAAELAAARASEAQGAEELEQARRDLARFEGVSGAVLAPSELDAARSRVAALSARQDGLAAAARRAGVLLERHRVRAPFAGLVTGRHVDPGDWVAPGQPVLDLVSSAAIEVRVPAPPELVDALTVGAEVTLLGATEHPARVAALVPVLDEGTRTALIRVAPADPLPGWLVPGSVAEVRFGVEQRGSGVIVPRDALVLGPGGSHVVKVVDGVAQPLDVTVVATNADEALVRGEGLAAGDPVVVRGNERLRAGQTVEVGQVTTGG